MRSLKAIMNDEDRAWKELHDIDNEIMTYDIRIADITKIPVSCPAKEYDIEECERIRSEYLIKREAAVEMLNRRRDELREYFGELIPNRW